MPNLSLQYPSFRRDISHAQSSDQTARVLRYFHLFSKALYVVSFTFPFYPFPLTFLFCNVVCLARKQLTLTDESANRTSESTTFHSSRDLGL